MSIFRIPSLTVGDPDLLLDVVPPVYALRRVGGELLISGRDYRPSPLRKSEVLTGADCAALIASVYERELDEPIREALDTWANEIEEGFLTNSLRPRDESANKGYHVKGSDAETLALVAAAAANYCVGHDLGTVQAQIEVMEGALKNEDFVPKGKFVVVAGASRTEYGDLAAALVSYSALKMGSKSLWEVTNTGADAKLWMSNY
jgi:hypothetical protein